MARAVQLRDTRQHRGARGDAGPLVARRLHASHARKGSPHLDLSQSLPQPSSGQDGWAHYTEQLMVDEGYGGGDPRYRLAQQSDALTRICRLLSGIRLHKGEWSLADAQRCFEEEAYLATPAAVREAERGTYDPTYGGYFLGKRGVLALREDYAAKMGAEFDMKEFHERIMSQGIAPIWAHRQLMLPGDTSAVIR